MTQQGRTDGFSDIKDIKVVFTVSVTYTDTEVALTVSVTYRYTKVALAVSVTYRHQLRTDVFNDAHRH